MSRYKPTCEQLKDWKEEKKSFTWIKNETGYSKATISGWYKDCDISLQVGRKAGSQVSEETRQKMSETRRKLWEEYGNEAQ